MGCVESSPAASAPEAASPPKPGGAVDPSQVVITGQLVRAPSQNRMPERTRAFFTKLDRNKDNRVSLEELQAGFEREFKGSLREHAKQEIATLFEAHAQAEGGWGPMGSASKTLKPGSFNRFYAEVLFKHFDANNNGYLELAEAEEALRFLRPNKADGGGKDDVHVAFPTSAYTESGELRLPKAWFFALYQSME
jgi:hypothetical protein